VADLTEEQHSKIVQLTNSVTTLLNARRPREFPWLIRVYLGLLIFCTVLIFLGVFVTGKPAESVLAEALQDFKIVVGAAIGALSAAAHQQWGGAPTPPPADNTNPLKQ
jgi:hypothetical protein